MTQVLVIDRDGVSHDFLSAESDEQIIATARAEGARRVEIHEFQSLAVWPEITECPANY